MTPVILCGTCEGDRLFYESSATQALDRCRRFACGNGWEHLLREPLVQRIEVTDTQEQLWERVRDLEGMAGDSPLPAAGLAAAVTQDILVAVSIGEYRRLWPEYTERDDAYMQLLAHELGHVLHLRIVNGREENMGPRWFYEAFASHVAGMIGTPVRNEAEALAAREYSSRGSYSRYAGALSFYRRFSPMPDLVESAGRPDFDSYLSSITLSRLT